MDDILELDLLHATISNLSLALETGTISSVSLTAAYIDRINQVNEYFRAVLEINPDAECITKALGEEQKVTKRCGPLHGIPILFKDSIATLDSMQTTAGSSTLIGTRPSQDAHLVQKFRQDGAVILGKINMSEWANFRTVTGDTGGWSPRGGLAYGPFYPNMRASGSSSGSAVATALGLAAASIGAEKAVKVKEYFGGEGGIPGVIDKYGVDVVAAPASYGPMVSLAARGGLPVIVVPLGKYPDGTEVEYLSIGGKVVVDVGPGIPFGVTFAGGAHSERTLLWVAYAFEQLKKVRQSLVSFNAPKAGLKASTG
ncbi:amidase signature domain-containing protein [Podospora fimiseda]|uniref:Amidase signature domain-containing protein n=1 Tax=Podospora fimiseda TaxID=252190 RepID=A0AAN7BHN0_9PEZI|nr:amidase signature domain-containing protein [Podospora fimiseda]